MVTPDASLGPSPLAPPTHSLKQSRHQLKASQNHTGRGGPREASRIPLRPEQDEYGCCQAGRTHGRILVHNIPKAEAGSNQQTTSGACTLSQTRQQPQPQQQAHTNNPNTDHTNTNMNNTTTAAAPLTPAPALPPHLDQQQAVAKTTAKSQQRKTTNQQPTTKNKTNKRHKHTRTKQETTNNTQQTTKKQHREANNQKQTNKQQAKPTSNNART